MNQSINFPFMRCFTKTKSSAPLRGVVWDARYADNTPHEAKYCFRIQEKRRNHIEWQAWFRSMPNLDTGLRSSQTHIPLPFLSHMFQRHSLTSRSPTGAWCCFAHSTASPGAKIFSLKTFLSCLASPRPKPSCSRTCVSVELASSMSTNRAGQESHFLQYANRSASWSQIRRQRFLSFSGSMRRGPRWNLNLWWSPQPLRTTELRRRLA